MFFIEQHKTNSTQRICFMAANPWKVEVFNTGRQKKKKTNR